MKNFQAIFERRTNGESIVNISTQFESICYKLALGSDQK